jgi:putative DNA primase/helicase
MEMKNSEYFDLSDNESHLTDIEELAELAIKEHWLSDLMNAKIFVHVLIARYRYFENLKIWYYWNDKFWQEKSESHLLHAATKIPALITQTSERFTDDTKSKIRAHAIKSSNNGKIEAFYKLAKRWPSIQINEKMMNDNPWLINCENGTYDLEFDEFRDHDQYDFLTNILPVKYNPDADYSEWAELIDRVMCGDENLSRYLQKCLGYSLILKNKEQILFFCVGVGSNGKSTILETILKVLGNYAATAQFTTFKSDTSDGDKPRPDLLRLRDKRMLVVNEPEAGRSMNESLIKQITGGDNIAVRGLYSNKYVEFQLNSKIWVACNSDPVIKGNDHGIWRRIRKIPFDAKFSKDDVDFDPNIMDKIENNLEGVLLWMIEGTKMYLEEGLESPPEIEKEMYIYRETQDIISEFLNEKTVMDETSRLEFVYVRELYRIYVQWCESNVEKPLKQRTFSLRLSERGIKKDNKGNKRILAWTGIRIRADYE